MSGIGPTLPAWALHQVGGYLGYTSRGASVFAKAALDPYRSSLLSKRTSRHLTHSPGRRRTRTGAGTVRPSPHVCEPGVHLSSRGRHGRLHHVFHNVFTDLKPHIGPDTSREAIVEAGPDASIRNLFGKGRHVGPAVGHAGRGGARHRDLGDVHGSERRLDDRRDGAAEDAMCARIFRMHRRVVDRLPGHLAICGRVAINIAVANRGDRSPEVVMVLGVKHRHQRVVEPNRHDRHEPRTVADTHLLCCRELTYEGVIGWWPDHEPEPGGLSLLRRPLRTVFPAIAFELVEVCGPLLALQRNRRSVPVMMTPA